MRARIYQPPKNAMQSGKARTHCWLLEYEPESAKAPDPLMGWTSSSDMRQQVQLEFATPLDKMKLVDETAMHDKFGLAGARLVASGHPEQSVLLHRIAMRGRGQMPQLATSVVDQAAVSMIAEWIRELPVSALSPDRP